MSSGQDMKYLAMRAKKMSVKAIPTPKELQDRFRKKGTEITVDQARSLVAQVKAHQEAKAGKASASAGKPAAKQTVSAPMKRSTSYGPR